MGNAKKARGIPDPAGLPPMTHLGVHLDVEQHGFPLDPKRMVAAGDLSDIGLMRNATGAGKAGVLLIVTLPDGSQVAAETTWALLRTAYAALAASPIVAEEVIDP